MRTCLLPRALLPAVLSSLFVAPVLASGCQTAPASLQQFLGQGGWGAPGSYVASLHDLNGDGKPDVSFVSATPSSKVSGVYYFLIDNAQARLSNGTYGTLIWLNNITREWDDYKYYYPIPFNKLVLSQSNVRRVKAGVSIEQLAESIAQRTLLQSLNVRAVADAEGNETGMFEVPAGGRRYRALELLVTQKRMAKTQPVPCVVREGGIAEDDSLAENDERVGLHPLDQFRAFRTLRDAGLTEEDIADTVAAFAKAAADAERLGFDTIEIHGAHGYLIDEFFWPGTNRRTDRYGGPTIRERATFAKEVVRAIRAAVSPDFPVILRISQWKQQDFEARLATTPDELAEWLAPLVEAGADIIHCSQRRFWEPEFPEIDGQDGLNLAGWAKKVTGAPTISVGSVGLSGEFLTAFAGQGSQVSPLDNLLSRMERDEFDLIAVGRALLTDPNWPHKVQAAQFDQLLGFDPQSLAQLV